MSALMVVMPEPSVKGCGAFGARAVDGAVGPAAEKGADEPFGLAVGLGPIGAGAQMTDPERVAGDGVHRGAIGASVVGHHPLDGDAMARVERDSSFEETDDGGPALIVEDSA